MHGLMMDYPLTIPAIVRRTQTLFTHRPVASRRPDRRVTRTTYATVLDRVRRLAVALRALGVKPGDRVATLAWASQEHLETYLAAPSIGAVLHTLNLRLHCDDLAYIVNDAQDKVLCVDLNLLPLVEKLAPAFKGIKHVIVMTDRAHMPAQSSLPNLLCYDDLVEAEDGNYAWPEFDENAASSICYTSGTTGNPKGAVYSHRSTVLHAYAAALPA